MFTSITSITKPLALLLLATSYSLQASPWIDTSDAYLRSCIDNLAQSGVLTLPVNTYPLMWVSLQKQVNNLEPQQIPPGSSVALRCVRRALKNASQTKTSLALAVTNKTPNYVSFGENTREQASLSLASEFEGETWAFKPSVKIREQSSGPAELQGHQVSYQDSYLAGRFGNWVVSADQIPVWWGPGKDSALALSNNAEPFPALRLSRHQSEAFESSWLNWIGPWSLTTYLGQQERSNQVKQIKLWGMRVNMRPLDSLEIGLTRTAQFAGGDRKADFATFWDLFTGNDNIANPEDPDAISRDEEPGNQLAGIDAKWHLLPLIDLPLSLYAEVVGEDEAGMLPSHTLKLLGAEYQMSFQNNSFAEIYFEYSDTMAMCGDFSELSNCAYQHHLYPEGYRRYGRSMGSTYDNDSRSMVLGYQHVAPGWQGYVKLKVLSLNRDRVAGGNTQSPYGRDEKVLALGLRTELWGGELNSSLSLHHYSETQDSGLSNGELSDAYLSLAWKIQF